MTSLISLDKKSREALLDSIATLTSFFWGPDTESSREIQQGSSATLKGKNNNHIEMEVPVKIIDETLKEGRTTLTEYESKKVLAFYDLPVTREKLVSSLEDLLKAAQQIGYPLVIKGSSAEIAHKTEMGLIRVDVRNDEESTVAFREISAAMNGAGDGAVLVQQMVKGQRELVVGLTRDAQFGPCVMFGLGGIFTEILKDTVFRVAPLEKQDALEMMKEIKASKILEAIRGMAAADKDMLAEMLMTMGRIGIENDAIKEIDINPVIISNGKPIAVDALVVLQEP